MRISKALVSFLLVLLLSSLAQAHEFWMQPDKFRFNPGEVMKLNFKVGENFMGEPWNLQRHRITRLDHHTQTRSTGLLEQVNTGQGDNLQVMLETEGTHLLVMQSNNAFIELEADKFNAYLKEDGLEDIWEYRNTTNALNKSAKEYYQRSAKLLVQAGKVTDATFKKRVGLPVEIVPLKNPYAQALGDVMKFQVFFEGQPLAFWRMKVWNRKDNRTMIQNIYTEKDGTFTTRLSNSGAWMVSCVKMVPSREEGADWQSYWGSLVFGY